MSDHRIVWTNEKSSEAAFRESVRGSTPIALKAGDPRVLINGEPSVADFRIVSEDYYQKLLNDLLNALDDVRRLERKLDAEYRARTDQ